MILYYVRRVDSSQFLKFNSTVQFACFMLFIDIAGLGVIHCASLLRRSVPACMETVKGSKTSSSIELIHAFPIKRPITIDPTWV